MNPRDIPTTNPKDARKTAYCPRCGKVTNYDKEYRRFFCTSCTYATSEMSESVVFNEKYLKAVANN